MAFPLLALCLLVFSPNAAYAVYFKHPYFPPEAVYRHHYQDTFKFPGPINLNVASLEELKTLPEVDDNVGLKLIRIRPLNTYQDLYKLPYISKQQVTRLIEKIKPLSQF
ncbi:MAG: helix-hairpin-helix domain-containing protein [Cyanobacteria bacterium]|nr:helix-hairpin-helix domain-containing protein [Cyanobacteriota bacterium]